MKNDFLRFILFVTSPLILVLTLAIIQAAWKHLIKLYNKFKYRHLRPTIKCNKLWYGNDCGFYLNPDLLNKDSIVYSFGVGEDISFDRNLFYKHGCDMYTFDPTPKSIKWMKEQKEWTPAFYHFGLARESGKAKFYLPKNEKHVSGSMVKYDGVGEKIGVEMVSFPDIKKSLGHDEIHVVKMDIEGTEYDVIDQIEADQIVLELHERFFKDGKQKSIRLVNSLRQRGYEIFAGSDREVSFIKRELV